MLASLLIVFREVLEAGLIVGIVLAATEGIAQRGRWIAAGIGAGLLGAAVLAAAAGLLSSAFAGNGQELLNAAILIVATLMLAWHTVFMARHGREMAEQMRQVGSAVATGRKPLAALAVVVAVAVLREGAEVVLFLYAIAAASQSSPAAMLAGGAMGVALGAALSWLVYAGLVLIPLRRLFAVTGVLISLLAAGMAGQAAAILANANLIPPLGWQIWDTSWLVSSGSLAGRALQTLIGYSDRPMGIQLIAWGVTLVALLLAGRAAGRPRKSRSRPFPKPRRMTLPHRFSVL